MIKFNSNCYILQCNHLFYSLLTKKPTLFKRASISYKIVDPPTADNPNVSPTKISPLFILHGAFGSKNNNASISKILSTKLNAKIVLLDAINHGDNFTSKTMTYAEMAEDVSATMNELNIPKINLIGHSMGGRTAIKFCVEYPNLVDNLIVVDIHPFDLESKWLLHCIDAMTMVKHARVQTRKEADEILQQFIGDKMIRSFLLTNFYVVEYKNYMNCRIPLHFFKKEIEEGVFTKPIKIYEPIKINTKFIFGKNSEYYQNVIRNEYLKKLYDYFPYMQVDVLDAKHWIPYEKPVEFTESVSKMFIK